MAGTKGHRDEGTQWPALRRSSVRPPCRTWAACGRSSLGRPAFTLVELLIVIVVIGVLIAMVAVLSTHVVKIQKVNSTRTLMNNLKLAIDQFAEKNPLRTVYDGATNKSFGPYPPYQLADQNGNAINTVKGDWAQALCVRTLVEPVLPGDVDGVGGYSLGDRLARDLNLSNPSQHVKILAGDTDNDDIRALYAYLKIFAPATLSSIPPKFMQRLTKQSDTDWVDTIGGSGPANQFARTDIMGFVDAWGVPLDYLMYVRVEFAKDAQGNRRLFVRERVPVIRSRGIEKEVFDARRTAKQVIDNPSAKWIFSSDFPSPAMMSSPVDAAFWDTGVADLSLNANGWSRLVGQDETYGYVPNAEKDR